jgi:hypothetical protein
VPPRGDCLSPEAPFGSRFPLDPGGADTVRCPMNFETRTRPPLLCEGRNREDDYHAERGPAQARPSARL